MDEYRLDITAIQEMRWIGEGVIEKKNHMVFYSCHNKEHIFGTGFIVNKRRKHLIMDFQSKSHRLCRLRIRGKFFNYSLICAHAPTEEKNDEDKDSFYDELDEVYNECPRGDYKIILGDMNAKIGKENEYKPCIGKYSLHENSNDNGIRLIHFSSSRNMVVGSSIFNHRDIHKMTWKSPDGNTVNQIDHILIDARHFSNLIDVRSYRGANIDSDHYLVVATISGRISNVRKTF